PARASLGIRERSGDGLRRLRRGNRPQRVAEDVLRRESIKRRGGQWRGSLGRNACGGLTGDRRRDRVEGVAKDILCGNGGESIDGPASAAVERDVLPERQFRIDAKTSRAQAVKRLGIPPIERYALRNCGLDGIRGRKRVRIAAQVHPDDRRELSPCSSGDLLVALGLP